MHQQSKAKVWFWSALAVALTLSISLQSIGAFQAVAPRPAKVAIVDIKKVFDSLTVTTNAQAQIDALADKMEEERKAKAKRGETIQAELDALVRGTDKYNEVLKKISQALIDYEVYKQFALIKLSEREAEKIRTGYEAIRAGASQFAQQHGYDLVLVNDSLEDLQRGSPEEVLGQISRRRVLFAAEEIDITEALIDWINHKHQQAQAKP